ncbi:hypothetical protein LXL04_030560 [Taraxacum kok-saghyz]
MEHAMGMSKWKYNDEKYKFRLEIILMLYCIKPLHYLLKPVNGLNLTSHINLNGILCTKKRIRTKCGQVWNVFTHLGHYPKKYGLTLEENLGP